jgi:DUF4097 and DUF4098 domain-containing protein YvlB
MRSRTAVALTAFALLPLAGCFGGSSTTREMSYQIDERVTALVIDVRAASVAIEAADGPVTVTEKHRYSKGKPTTAHQVEGQRLHLSESGCGDDDARCDVEYTIRMPGAMSADITAQAGAVKVHGLAGNMHVTTQAGAVEGLALTSDEVTVKTEAGAASLEFAEAPMLIRTTTSVGAVELGVPGTAAYAVDVKTSMGASSVEVKQDPASKHRIEVRTEVGAVKIEELP